MIKITNLLIKTKSWITI